MEEINQQKMQVEEKNEEILDSINYARRIQTAILPSAKLMKLNRGTVTDDGADERSEEYTKIHSKLSNSSRWPP